MAIVVAVAGGYDGAMASFTAHLQHGRLVIDDSAFVGARGAPVALVLDDEGDELDDEERGRLEAVVEASFEASARGESYSAEQVLAELRSLRSR